MPLSKTSVPKFPKISPQPSLKTSISEHIINAARDTTSMMAAFPKSFDMIGNMPGYYTISTDPSIKPLQYAQKIEDRREATGDGQPSHHHTRNQIERVGKYSNISPKTICLDPQDLNAFLGLIN